MSAARGLARAIAVAVAVVAGGGAVAAPSVAGADRAASAAGVEAPEVSVAAAASPAVVGIRPVRVFDSGAAQQCVLVRAAADLPPEADGVFLNFTVADPTVNGYAVVYPDLDGTGRRSSFETSTVNFEPYTEVANSTYVPIPASGRICMDADGPRPVGYYYHGRNIIDVTGYTVAGSGVTGVPPYRLVDTTVFRAFRPDADNQLLRPLTPRTPHTVQVAGHAGVPADARAVLVNVTVTGPPRTPGNLRVYPGGAAVPTASTVNFAPGRDKANGTLVELVEGKLSLWSDSPVPSSESPVHVILDVLGYTRASSALTSVTPSRVLDTRATSRVGDLAGPLLPRKVYAFDVAGRGGVPAGATAVLLNVTAVGPTGVGNLRVYPDTAGDGTTSPPEASTINYVAGRDIPNQVLVPLVAGGRVALYSDTLGPTTHVAVDVVGFVRAP